MRGIGRAGALATLGTRDDGARRIGHGGDQGVPPPRTPSGPRGADGLSRDQSDDARARDTRLRDVGRTPLESESLIVKESAALEEQLGVFARRTFNKGETIFSVRGPVVTSPTRYSFSLDVDRHIDPRRKDGRFDFGHYLNHSCDPNTFIRIVEEQAASHIDIVARRAIATDEELNFDYASLEYDTIAQVACECGTVHCRGRIHGFRELPEVIRQSYEHEGMIPAYLLRM